MFCNRILAGAGAAVCLLSLALPAQAAEVDCDAVYCFSNVDFSQEETFRGICLTEVPGENGRLMLGTRILREGDVLTADQVARMTFAPLRSQADTSVEVAYLPVLAEGVAQESVMTLSIRGKEDKAPVAEDDALETYKNLTNSAKFKAKDPENQVLTFTITRQPRRGTLEVGTDGTFTYTPKKNKVGVDSFTYTAADPAGNISREATVTITILKPTEAPQYTDTLGKDCRFAAEWMKHTGIFVGEQVGESPCFGPETSVTRGQFLTMLVKALDLPVEEEAVNTGYEEVPQWLKPYLAAAMRSGLTAALPDQQTLGCDAVITGAEAAALLNQALDSHQEFAILTQAPLTRAEAAQALYQTVKILEQRQLDTLV